jgi:oligopeptide/dipeptide ABC transporter ATP-binding protein
MTATYLEVKDLRKHFSMRRGLRSVGSVRAVDGVNLELRQGETLGLVGESGCGKTTLLGLLLKLLDPTSGSILFKGSNLASLSRPELREYRRAVQPVFQNPFSSLDPRMRVARIVSEPLRVNTSLTSIGIEERVAEVLRMVGLHASDAERYPHEFSGGQRQRIAIARALASEPQVLILDEAVSSQDISIRAQILNLLRELQVRFGLTYLFVAHDLATVRYMSDRISVMYLGKIVESGPADQICERPLHPYTQALFASCLPDDPQTRKEFATLPGEMPSPLNPPAGCRFHTRCPHAKPECISEEPRLKEVTALHRVACVLHQSYGNSNGDQLE